MKRIIQRIFTCYMLVAVHAGCAQTVSTSSQNGSAVALVLKVTGENGIPDKCALFSINRFEGRVKEIQKGSDESFSQPYKLTFLNAKGEILYQTVLQNPLQANMESFEENGTISRHVVIEKAGYINIRFAVLNNLTEMKAMFSRIENEKEIVVSTLNITLP